MISGLPPANHLKRWEWIAFAAICAVAAGLRVAAMTHLGELYDEIVDVDWVGSWFSHHLLAYIFQWQHTFYPPQSPSFSNPPYAIYVFGIAIAALRPFGVSALIAARSANLVASLAVLWILYVVAGRWLTGIARLAVPFFIAISPPAVVLGATAYQETIAMLGACLVLVAALRYFDAPSNGRWGWLALALGFAVLTKFTNLLVFAIVLFFLVRSVWTKRSPWWHLLALPFAVVLFGVVTWAGARDLHQLADAYDYVVNRRKIVVGDYSEYPRMMKYVYYALMFFGTQASAVAVTLVLGIIAAIVSALRRTPAAGETLWLGIFAFLLVALGPLVQFSTRHQLGTPLPAGAMLFGFAIARAVRWRAAPAAAAACAVIALDAVSVFVGPPSTWNAFNNAIVGRMPQQLYATGDGDMLPAAAAWIAANVPDTLIVGTVAGNYLIMPQLPGTYRPDFAFPGDTIESLNRRQIRVLVVPGDFLGFAPTPIVGAAQDSKLLHTVNVSGKPYIYIYSVPVIHVPTHAEELRWCSPPGIVDQLNRARRLSQKMARLPCPSQVTQVLKP